MTVLVWSIILPMDRAWLSPFQNNHPIIHKPTTNQHIDVGGAITGGRVINSMLRVNWPPPPPQYIIYHHKLDRIDVGGVVIGTGDTVVGRGCYYRCCC